MAVCNRRMLPVPNGKPFVQPQLPKEDPKVRYLYLCFFKKFRYILFYSSLQLFPGFSFSAADNPITFLQFFMFSHFDHQAKIPKKATYVGSKMMHFSYFFNPFLWVSLSSNVGCIGCTHNMDVFVQGTYIVTLHCIVYVYLYVHMTC